jgi:hypothetical protein
MDPYLSLAVIERKQRERKTGEIYSITSKNTMSGVLTLTECFVPLVAQSFLLNRKIKRLTCVVFGESGHIEVIIL